MRDLTTSLGKISAADFSRVKLSVTHEKYTLKNIHPDNSEAEIEQQCYRDDVADKPERRTGKVKGHQLRLSAAIPRRETRSGTFPLRAEKTWVLSADHFKVRAPLV